MDGIRSMNQVYSRSAYPVALLGRPVKNGEELRLLHGILTRKYTCSTDKMTSYERTTHRREAGAALTLLHDIIGDLWWQRAWTFQENMMGGEAINLLIPHDPSLERLKRSYNVSDNVFGDVSEELCISSCDFSRAATLMCRAIQQLDEVILREQEAMIHTILRRAGRYTMLLEGSASMTPSIVTDVLERVITCPSDRLDIIANCCAYPTRLDVRELKRAKQSLSISLLATCLRNGEIFCDHPSKDMSQWAVSELSVSKFLERHTFKASSPLMAERKLSFLKGVRFHAVTLTKAGQQTEGHLWDLGPIIRFAKIPCPVYLAKGSRKCALTQQDHYHLTRLYHALERLSEDTLAGRIKYYLNSDAQGKRQYRIGEDYMLLMAREVARAIGEGRSIRLGRLHNPGRSQSPFTAAFIWDEALESIMNVTTMVFTSLQPKPCSRSGYAASDVDRHVSVAVTNLNTTDGGQGHIPQLRIERSVYGMCFFSKSPKRDVLFPYPSAFRQIVPSFARYHDTAQARRI